MSLIRCGFCRSADLQSNSFSNVPLDDAVAGAAAALRSERPAHAALLMLAWGGVEVLNWMLPEWKCTTCGNRF
jgi:hypothetical protein